MAASTDTTTNVKVAVRCRPMSRREIDQGHSSIVEVDDAGKTMTLQTERGPRSFTFDHAYGADSSQSQVYEDLALPLVAKAINGYNGTVFAYGQTGSGKTWTMSGNDDHPGIIPHLHQDLFRYVVLPLGPPCRRLCQHTACCPPQEHPRADLRQREVPGRGVVPGDLQ